MKKLINLSTCLLFLFSCKSDPTAIDSSNTARITGEATRNYVGQELYLKYIQNDSVYTDTVTVAADGSFEFEVREADYPAKAFLTTDLSNHAPKVPEVNQLSSMIYFHYGSPSVPEQFGNKKDILFFLLAPGNTHITISDSIYNSSMENSPVNDELEELALELHEVMARQIAFSKTDLSAVTDPKELDSLLEISTQLSTEKTRILDSYIRQNPDTYASIVAFNVKPYVVAEDVALFSSIDPELRNSSLAFPGRRKVMQYINTKNINDTITSFTLRNEKGEEIALEELDADYILLDFWASWCRPCRTENRKISEFYSQYDPKDFQMVGISIDDDREKWLKALEDDNITWTSVHDPEMEVNNDFGVSSYPTNFLIDRNYKIIEKNLKAEELQLKLEELL